MKTGLMLWTILVLAVAGRADLGFLQRLPGEDFAAAGLQKLTPDELACLESLVQNYRARGPTKDGREAAEQTSDSATKEVKTEVNHTTPEPKQPGWFTALLTLNRVGEKPEKEQPLESRLVGDFDGWNGRSVFQLENGTRWLQQNKTDHYDYSPTLHSPRVKIRPASLRGYWLEIEGVNRQVRVTLFALSESK